MARQAPARIATKRVGIAAILLVSVYGAACGSATEPSQRLHSLAIVPNRSSLYVGESFQFRAVGQFGDGHTEDMPATWTTSGDQIRLGLPGEVTGAASGQAGLSAAALGKGATLSIEVVEDIRGTWAGISRTETCNRISGNGPAYCARSDGQNKRTEFTVVEQAGKALVLAMSIESTSGSVTAELSSLRVFRPIGVPDLISNLEFGPVHRRLMDWQLELRGTGPSRELVGSFLMEYDMHNAFGRNIYRDTYLVTLSKQ